jgi:hypothetical protein
MTCKGQGIFLYQTKAGRKDHSFHERRRSSIKKTMLFSCRSNWFDPLKPLPATQREERVEESKDEDSVRCYLLGGGGGGEYEQIPFMVKIFIFVNCYY